MANTPKVFYPEDVCGVRIRCLYIRKRFLLIKSVRKIGGFEITRQNKQKLKPRLNVWPNLIAVIGLL